MMMGLGSFGGGVGCSSSSSASSNLSPLAPPFTVDRSTPKPNSNPLLNFPDSSYGAVPFSQTWQYPAHPSAPRPEFDVDSTKTTYTPLTGDFRFSASSESNNPTQWSAISPSPEPLSGVFSYSSSDLKPYYSPYVSSVRVDDAPLLAVSGPTYELLPTSCVITDNEPSQVDYTQSLSGLEYTPQRGGVWNGVSNGKCGNGSERDHCFSSEFANAGSSDGYRNYMNQGGKSVLCGSQYVEDSGVSLGRFTGTVEKEGCTGLSMGRNTEDEPFLAHKFGAVPFESSKTHISGSNVNLTEPHSQGLSIELPKTFSSHQKLYCQYGKSDQPFGSSISDPVSVTKYSPNLVIRPPIVPSNAFADKVISSKPANPGAAAALRIEESNTHKFPEEKESHSQGSLDGTCGSSWRNFKEDHIFHASSSTNEDILRKMQANISVDDSVRTRSGSQVWDMDASHSFSPGIEAAKYAEISSDSVDHHNPAVDSPCWRGAPGGHFSPDDDFEDDRSGHFIRTLEQVHSLDLQGKKIVSDSVTASQKPSENITHKFIGILGSTSKSNSEQESRLAEAEKIFFPFPRIDNVGNPTKGYDALNGSRVDEPKSFSVKQLDQDFASTGPNLRLQESGFNLNDAAEGGAVAFRAAENVLCSPSSQDETAGCSKPSERRVVPKIDVQLLVNAIHNMSELLLFHCSSDECSVKEKDLETLKHVITNVEACLSYKNVSVAPLQETMFLEESDKHGQSGHRGVGNGEVHSPAAKAAALDSDSQLYHQLMHGGNKNCDVSGEKAVKLQPFLPLRCDAELSDGDNVVQAIKNALSESFHCQEELQSETLLFKNLWLEAEAKLCSISSRARFDRVKIEMEINQATKTKENAANVDKILASSTSLEPNITPKLAPETEDGSVTKSSCQSSSIASPANLADDVEASVMARFHILKCRGDNLVQANREDKHQPDMADTEFTGNRNLKPVIEDQLKDESLNVAVEPYFKHPNGKSNEGVSGTKGRGGGLRNERSSGWYDNSSSDWEHVLKDEFAWRN